MSNIKVFLWVAFAIVSTVWSMDPANKDSPSSSTAPEQTTSISKGLQRAINSRHRPVPHIRGLSRFGIELENHFHTNGIEEHLQPNLRWINLSDKARNMKAIIKKPETKNHKIAGKNSLQAVHSDMKIYKSHDYLPTEVTDKMIDQHGQRSKSFWKKLTRSKST